MGKAARNRQRDRLSGQPIHIPADLHDSGTDWAEIDAAVRAMEADARMAVALRYADVTSLAALSELWRVKLDAEQRAGEMVVRLKRDGVSWAAIGRVTGGISGQGAMARWRKLLDPPAAGEGPA